jgi:hypothetical protein
MTGRDLATRFYRAFRGLDHETMAGCYTSDARFTDPVFDLVGPEIGTMWRALCSGSTDLEIGFDVIDGSDQSALVDWEARYTFPPTGRPVHNRIQTRMALENGLISRQLDQFDFYRWTRQAFGMSGALLGWTPPFKTRVRRGAVRAIK